MILVVVKNPIKPKYADEFPSLIAEFTEATRAEPGNVCFDWYRSVDDPNMYVLVEAFADRAAGDLHTSTEHFQKAMASSAATSPTFPRSSTSRYPRAGHGCPRCHNHATRIATFAQVWLQASPANGRLARRAARARRRATRLGSAAAPRSCRRAPSTHRSTPAW